MRGNAGIERGRIFPAIARIPHTRVCRKKLTGPKIRQTGPKRHTGPPREPRRDEVPDRGASNGQANNARCSGATAAGGSRGGMGKTPGGREMRGDLQARPDLPTGPRESRSKTGADKKRTALRRKARGGSDLGPDGHSVYSAAGQPSFLLDQLRAEPTLVGIRFVRKQQICCSIRYRLGSFHA